MNINIFFYSSDAKRMIFQRLPFSGVLAAAAGCLSCSVAGISESKLMLNVNYHFRNRININLLFLNHPSSNFHKQFIKTHSIHPTDAASPLKESCCVRTPQTGAKEELLSSIDCVRETADPSTLYLLESVSLYYKKRKTVILYICFSLIGNEKNR